MAVSVIQTDLEAVWRPLTAAEAATVAGRSNSAWLRIAAAVPDIEARLAAVPPKTTTATVKDVMVSMMLRVFKNPDGLRSYGGSIDDGSENVTVDSALSTGELYVSAAELVMLRPEALPQRGMYVVGLGG